MSKLFQSNLTHIHTRYNSDHEFQYYKMCHNWILSSVLHSGMLWNLFLNRLLEVKKIKIRSATTTVSYNTNKTTHLDHVARNQSNNYYQHRVSHMCMSQHQDYSLAHCCIYHDYYMQHNNHSNFYYVTNSGF